MLRHPSQIANHFEELSMWKLDDHALQTLLKKLIAHAFTKETLDIEGVLTILQQTDSYNVARGLLRADALNFTFNRKLPEDASLGFIKRAHDDLAEAIKVVTARPGLEAALAQATQRAQNNLDEASFAEQQRLIVAKNEFGRKLVELTQLDDGLV